MIFLFLCIFLKCIVLSEVENILEGNCEWNGLLCCFNKTRIILQRSQMRSD